MPPGESKKVVLIVTRFSGFIDFPNPFSPPEEILAALNAYSDCFEVRCERVAVRDRMQRLE
jgi:hypothetical protein